MLIPTALAAARRLSGYHRRQGRIVSHGVVSVALKTAAISGLGLLDQRATTGRLSMGSSLKGAMVASVM